MALSRAKARALGEHPGAYTNPQQEMFHAQTP